MYVTILEDWLTFHLQKVRIILEFRVKRTDCKSSNIDRSFILQSCYKIDLPNYTHNQLSGVAQNLLTRIESPFIPQFKNLGVNCKLPFS